MGDWSLEHKNTYILQGGLESYFYYNMLFIMMIRKRSYLNEFQGNFLRDVGNKTSLKDSSKWVYGGEVTIVRTWAIFKDTLKIKYVRMTEKRATLIEI